MATAAPPGRAAAPGPGRASRTAFWWASSTAWVAVGAGAPTAMRDTAQAAVRAEVLPAPHRGQGGGSLWVPPAPLGAALAAAWGPPLRPRGDCRSLSMRAPWPAGRQGRGTRQPAVGPWKRRCGLRRGRTRHGGQGAVWGGTGGRCTCTSSECCGTLGVCVCGGGRGRGVASYASVLRRCGHSHLLEMLQGIRSSLQCLHPTPSGLRVWFHQRHVRHLDAVSCWASVVYDVVGWAPSLLLWLFILRLRLPSSHSLPPD